MEDYLESVVKQFQYYKLLGEKALNQVPESQYFYAPNEESNSLAVIVKHLSGNMLSRWTDFLTSDGEKEWRNREGEFENDFANPEQVWEAWNRGWDCFLGTLTALKTDDLTTIIYIRNQGHSVVEAINRQLAHYPYHIGQMIYLSKLIVDGQWNSLSIPKGKSQEYNQQKFSKPKSKEHFTEEYIHPKIEKKESE